MSGDTVEATAQSEADTDNELLQPEQVEWNWHGGMAIVSYAGTVTPVELDRMATKLRGRLPEWSIEGRYHPRGLQLCLYYDGEALNGNVLEDRQTHEEIEASVTRLLYSPDKYLARVQATFDTLPNGTLTRGVVEFCVLDGVLPDNVKVRRYINANSDVCGTVLVNGGKKLRFNLYPVGNDTFITLENARLVIDLAAGFASITIVGTPDFTFETVTPTLD